MEEKHSRQWEKVLEMILESDLTNKSIVDFGCNQGGFLRFLYRERPFYQGVGIDLAIDSIAVANARKADLPLSYYATTSIAQFSQKFNIATSISVIYLISDLATHAKEIKAALKPEGVYYATFTDYRNHPSMKNIEKIICQFGMTKMNLHTLDDIASAFFAEGFDVQVRRMLPSGYIPLDKNERWFLTTEDRLQFEYEEAYRFRMVAPRK
ncbi:class I SAM-dependent methyltransferase [Lysinibacillus sphaericus]|uniref:class I SAM-dependent methyltransferase n=1 Tax=Lysinibacillus sphaericus TaxID=1421 RepID=UPI003F7970BA